MFRFSGAVHGRARILSVLSPLLALGVTAGLVLPVGPAQGAGDSVFIQGTAAPTVTAPAVPSPTVSAPKPVPGPAVPTAGAPAAAAPSAAAPAAAPQNVPPVAAPTQPAQPAQAAPPKVEVPHTPDAPPKVRESAKRKDKKSRKVGKEAPPAPEKAATISKDKQSPEKAQEPARRGTPTKTEEAAEAYSKGDYDLAESIWRAQAEAGDGQAMNNLGVLYDLGQGVEPDMGRALHWFAQSAKTGHASGMSNYGRMLEQGRGIEANPEEAARWFDLAARQGQPEAQFNLGMLYELGRGVQKDDRAAAAWYSRAAAQQQTEALSRLGHFYRTGQGVTKNESRAALLLYAAAMNGEQNAIQELEDMAKTGPARPEAVLFGQRLDNTDRATMREALKSFGAKATREDDAFICDLYEAGRLAPGAHQMAICYAPGQSGRLGFLELDYTVPNNTVEEQVLNMIINRFGPASAGEGDDAHLWNLGSVVVATRYEPTRKLMSLMYMVPRVYHLTRQN